MKTTCATALLRQHISAITSQRKACPSFSLREATPFILMPRRSCRTSRLSQFPGVALAVELYLEGGIRSVEIGSLMFGEHATMDLVRLAIPRRVYTQSHIEYVVEVILDVWRRRETIAGYRIEHQAPFLRHFSARLKPVTA